MHVVFDTTAFHPFKLERTKPLLRIFQAAERPEWSVYVAEVVIAETTRHHRRDFVEPALTKIRAARKAVAKTHLAAPGLAGLQLDAQAPTDQFEEELREELADHSVKTLALPGIDHASVLDRIMAARKPSKPDEDSYRDILIWHGLIELLQSKGGTALLVSNNWKDFGASKASHAVHPDLAEDLVAAGLAPTAVERFNTPAEVVAKYFAVEDEVTGRMQAMVVPDAPGYDHLTELLRDAILGEEITGDLHLGLRGESDVESVIVASVYSLDVSLAGVYEIERDAMYGVSLEVKTSVELDVLVTAPSPWDLATAAADEVIGDRSGGGYLISSRRPELLIPVDLLWDETTKTWVADEAYLGEVTELGERPVEIYEGPVPDED